MTTYSTGNPIGSADPRDLYDNAQTIDRFANSDESTATDRLGETRRTIAGMNADVDEAIAKAGYVILEEEYAAGIEVTAYNQVIRADGDFWRLSASEDLPYTTDGTGMPEGGAFVSVGDAVLRGELADPAQGGELVQVTTSTGEQTLAGALDDRLVVGSSTLRVNSVSALESFDVTGMADGQQVSVLSYHAPVFPSSDFKGGGLFYWDSNNTEASNGITVVQVAGVSNGRFIRLNVDAIDPAWAGAKGDGTTDDYPAINSALSLAITLQAPLKFGPGEFVINGTFDFDTLPAGGVSILGSEIRTSRDNYGTILVGSAGLQVMFKQSFSADQRAFRFKNLSFKSKDPWDDLTTRADLRAIDLFRCPWSEFENLSFFGITSGVHTRACYFSKYKKITVNRCKQGVFIDGDDGAGSYGFADHCHIEDVEFGGYINDYGLRMRGSKASVISGFDAEAGYTGLALHLEGVKGTTVTGCYVESFTNSLAIKIGPISGASLDSLEDFSQGVTVSGVHGLANTAGLILLERGVFDITLRDVREFRYDLNGRENQTSEWLKTTGVTVGRDAFHYLHSIRVESQHGSDRLPSVLLNNPRAQSFITNGAVIEKDSNRGYYGLTLDVGQAYVNEPLATSHRVVQQGTFGQNLSISATSTAGSRKISVNSTTNLNVGTWIDVGTETKFKVTSIDRTNNVVWLGRECSSNQSGVAVQYSPPTYV